MSTITRKIRIHNAEQFKEAFGETNPDYFYVFIAKVDGASNSSINVPDSIFDVDLRIWDNILSFKRITENDVYIVIPRYDWANNTLYNQYDSHSNTLFSNSYSFYVRTDDRNVYKCISNNRAEANSTVKPTGTSTEEFTTSDGYSWKFMYTNTSAIENKFLTDDFMPVQRPMTNDSSSQWLVQEAAVAGSVKLIEVEEGGNAYISTTGQFSSVTSNNVMLLDGSASSTANHYVGYSCFITSGPGAGQIRKIETYNPSTKEIGLLTPYSIRPTTASYYLVSPTVKIEGDGQNLSAYSIVDNNQSDIDSIIIISEGSGYYQANAHIQGYPGSGATARPILSPPNGHGYDAIQELGGHSVLMHTYLTGNESGTISANNDFRQYGLIKNPLIASNSSLATGDVYNQNIKLTLVNVTGSGQFVLDEKIVSDVDATTTYKVVEFANTNSANTTGILSVTSANGSAITVGSSFTAANSGITATINSIQLGDLLPYTGKILFVENRDVITRDAAQREDFRITFTF